MPSRAKTQLAEAVAAGVWRRIMLATTLAACAGLAHTALGQLSPADEVTETMMQAQAYDAWFLDMQYPFTSPLAVTYSADPVGISFSYGLADGQTINGAPVSCSGTASGDYPSGSYAWNSSLTVGGDNYATEYTAVWDPYTAQANGIINISPTERWVVTGTVTVNDDGSDSGSVKLQLQTISGVGGGWSDSGNPQFGDIKSTSSEIRIGPPTDWSITVTTTNRLGVNVDYLGTWQTIPEPGSFGLLLSGAVVAWVASIRRARRATITRAASKRMAAR